MNYKMVVKILAKAMLIEAILLIFPLIVGLIYGEPTSYLSYLIPMVGLVAIGLPLSFIKPKNKSIYAKEGFVIVALVWILFSLVGAVPFVIGGVIPNYFDAFFETVSGFTTTGSSVMVDVEVMPRSYMFWRTFAHWIGGMGILVFVLAILPGYDEGVMHVFRSESPGPSVGKLVSKMRFTARILYLIYFALSVILVIMLVCGEMNFFESLIHTFSVAGTGGLSMKNDSVMSYSLYSQMVMAVFMFIFSVNFNVYFLIVIGSVKKAFLCEELRHYLILTVLATVAIALNILSSCANFGEALSLAFFQVTSISSTTGFASTNFDVWPMFSKGILLVLMVIGACGGSTGGGIKVSRLAILSKSSYYDLKKLASPRSVHAIRYEGEVLSDKMVNTVKTFFVVWAGLVIVSTLILMLDGYCANDFLTHFSATLTCIGNVGPGFNGVGPMLNFSQYSSFSKVWLSFMMLVGRLEIFPMLILFNPSTWRRKR